MSESKPRMSQKDLEIHSEWIYSSATAWFKQLHEEIYFLRENLEQCRERILELELKVYEGRVSLEGKK